MYRVVQRLVDQLSEPKYDAVRRQTYLALDVPSWEEAEHLVGLFGPAVDGYKVGLELYHAAGPAAVERLVAQGKRVFLDLKLHDIPNTVRGAVSALCQLGVEMLNVHALGGRAMLEAAREAAEAARRRPLLVAVTVLTSLTDAELTRAGVPVSAAELVESLARLAVSAGMDGVVASARELVSLRAFVPSGFEIVVPGTRPVGSALYDQARSLTPGEAVLHGASRLVLGRAVTRAGDDAERLGALGRIWEEMLAAHAAGSSSAASAGGVSEL